MVIDSKPLHEFPTQALMQSQKETKVLKPPAYPMQQQFNTLSITIPEYAVPSTPNNTPTQITLSLDDLESKLNQLKRERDVKH